MNRDAKKEELANYLIDCGIATKEEVVLVAQINGDTLESMEAILYARTGYRDLEQIQDAE